ncbi:FAD/NAD(P)-binding oxidoreductase [Galbibacter sp. EGI 63066]|uniref:NAD(P)/FAD-dependent oxidoreductase n=1 Tax=Galbibacter sp. EGI 63066 TaxID=2993559 RepID=UPI0022493651|nr:FAD/NAD(P)-binding oxidoreductase [Galbibacter sp. EGI 63066]MCX2679926.1 FAD/NAD(P)-binding oxidoreductase [Galbibacter sp. EGI 63066]
MKHIAIIGNGISGITAARHIRKWSDHKITVISAESEYFFSRTALMYVYMGHQKFEHTQPYENWFWEKNRIELKKGYVSKVVPKENKLVFSDHSTLNYDELIIASGSKPNKFGWPGQDLERVQGLYSKQDLELLETNAPNNKLCKRAIIVGGGLIGIELAEMLRTRDIPVTFLVREDSFWNNVLPDDESETINKHIRKHHVDLRLSTELKEIKADENGRARAVITSEDEEIPCDFVGLTAGVSPNIDFLKNSGIELGKGVKVNRYLETNIPGIYAIGDCAEQTEPTGLRRPVEAVWYTGRMMGETVAQTLCGNKMAYQPGHWFNSAKFFDIEYQTYGWVWPKPKDDELHFYWEHSTEEKCIRIAYHKNSRAILGINSLGIRICHEVIDRWLSEEKSIDFVIENFHQANFDPEFYKQHHKAIKNSYKQPLQTV